MKTICIYHSIDLDGWMSAAIVLKWYEDTHLESEKTTAILDGIKSKETASINKINESLTMLGWNYGDEIPNLENYDKVIMCDVSFPAAVMSELWNRFYSSKEFQFIWIDHHISTIKEMNKEFKMEVAFIEGIRDTKYAACELTWKYFFPNEEMPEIVRLLGRYDCFGHKGTKEEQKVLKFQYGARSQIEDYNDAYRYLNYNLGYKGLNDVISEISYSGKSIYNYLKMEAKQIYKRAFPITMYEKFGNNYGEHYGYRFLCVNQVRFNPINFEIDYHKEGYDGFACFHYEKEKGWCFSLYNDNGEADCSLIAKQYSGGGHKGAAGFVVNDLKEVFR